MNRCNQFIFKLLLAKMMNLSMPGLSPGLLEVQSKEEGKDQESLQSNTTPDQEHLMGK